MEHLHAMLASDDLNIVSAVLEVLLALGRHRRKVCVRVRVCVCVCVLVDGRPFVQRVSFYMSVFLMDVHTYTHTHSHSHTHTYISLRQGF